MGVAGARIGVGEAPVRSAGGAAAADLDEVRAWCSVNCEGDFLIVLDRRVLFQSREDAALATLWWRAEER